MEQASVSSPNGASVRLFLNLTQQTLVIKTAPTSATLPARPVWWHDL